MNRKKTYLISIILSICLIGCDSGSKDNAHNNASDVVHDNVDYDTTTVILKGTEFTYRLLESTTSLTIWTTPPTRKVLLTDRAPQEESSGIKISAAGNEFEPFQLILDPDSSASSIKISISSFDSLGDNQKITLAKALYSGLWPDELTFFEPGQSISLSSTEPTIIWGTVYIPTGAPTGEYSTDITIELEENTLLIPLRLTVFDFTLPEKINYLTQINLSISELVGEGTVDEAKQMLINHRITPKSVTWPSGFNPSITWDNSSSDNPCEIFWDEPNESEQFSIASLAKKYILGENWSGEGFPSAMLFQFVNNSTPRPEIFCGISRGSHYGSQEYNAEWSQYLTALEQYLTANQMLSKTYYYVQNEPQNEEDYKLAAYLCGLTKAAAPNLKLAISEEPKPEIAEHPDGPCGYDIWIAHVRSFQSDYAAIRQKEYGESLWFYSLDHDPDPYFNPTVVDKQGIHMRIIPWVSWRYRARGWAYYDGNRYFYGTKPGIRAELLREGIEDYEYLLLANQNIQPRIDVEEFSDPTVFSVTSSLTSWTKNPDALMTLRYELGRFIEGSRDIIPVLEIENSVRERKKYYLNFQNPDGQPEDDPLIIDGDEYIKIGWEAYDSELGYGWSGEHIDNADIALFGYDDIPGYSEAEKSYIYDDYGRDNLFEFALENGKYEVTITVGRPRRGYPGDPYNATAEGQKIMDDLVSTDENPVITRSTVIELTDGSLSVETGGRSRLTGNWAYTFLSYIKIIPVD